MYTKLKGIMAENNYTQKKLAEVLEISETSLNLKLNGKRDFSLTEVKKISALFDKPIDLLFSVI